MFLGFWVFGFFLDSKKVQKKLNGNCFYKKNLFYTRKKKTRKHENMKTQKKPKIDAKTQKPVLKTHSV